MSKNVSVLVTDLDNTLFDWVDVWHASFSALLEELVRMSGLPRERLLDEIRAVHREHGTSEYAFVVEELPSLRARYPESDLAQVFGPALEARRRARNAALRLYPGVRETLCTLKQRGVLVIGYTESTAFYTSTRVRKLGLDGLLDILYSPADHDLPAGLTRDQVRRHPTEYYRFEHTLHRHTPAGELKPNPILLLDILADAGAGPEGAVYVGDSPMKDVAMAQDAGVTDVLALYGKAQDREAYDLLRRVTHWTDEDVARERRIVERGEVQPAHVLRESFAELLGLFHFARHAAPQRHRAVSA